MTYPTPHESFMDSISRWEGEWQAMPEDSGNWVNCPDGRKLIGTMRGVTPAAYAAFHGISPCSLTPEKMKAEITLAVAAAIGLLNYYDRPGFDDLEWSPLVWIAVDIGWGSGPARGIKMLQSLVGANPDGQIGPQTQAAYAHYIHEHEIGPACDALSALRRQFYLDISEPGSKNHKFRRGWLRRADYYTTAGNGEPDPWWPLWADWKPSGGSETGKPVALPSPLDRLKAAHADMGKALGEM